MNNNKNLEILNAHSQFLIKATTEYSWLYHYTENKFIYISPGISKIRGLSIEEGLKESLEESFTEESREKLKNLLKTRIKVFLSNQNEDNAISYLNEFKQYNKNKDIIDIEISFKFILDEENNSILILGVSHEISERKYFKRKLDNEIQKKDDIIQNLMVSEKHLSLRNELLKNIANTDELTGAYNRHYFDKIIPIEIERDNRYNKSLSFIFFDIDHFKKVNDTWGHAYGDNVLVKIAETVRANTRKPDIFARWGGEEFVILLPQTNSEGAIAVANKLKDLLENLEHPTVGKVTATFAVSQRINGENFTKWFKRIDETLYRAKNMGRNLVLSAETDTSSNSSIKIKWNKKWESGNKIIDRQHRYLIKLGNELIEALMNPFKPEESYSNFKEFSTYLKYHFYYEEKLHEQLKFSLATDYIKMHQEIFKKIQNINEDYLNKQLKISSIITFLIEDVIVNHLIKSDLLFSHYLNKN